MHYSKAIVIFTNIDDPRFSDEEKGEAIYKVLHLVTHNSITKDQMLKVIRYLLYLCFDVNTGGEDESGKV